MVFFNTDFNEVYALNFYLLWVSLGFFLVKKDKYTFVNIILKKVIFVSFIKFFCFFL